MLKTHLFVHHLKTIFGIILLLGGGWLVSCQLQPETGAADTSQNDWELVNPSEVGIDQDLLSELVEKISTEDYKNIHSLLIVKDGKLIFEEYFPGYAWDWDADQFQGEFTQFDAETPHVTMSVSKVFTSLLAGIALERGYFEDLSDPLFNYLPKYSPGSDPRLQEITLEHLLTMSSGLKWNGIEIPISTRDERSDVYQMNFSTDPIAYILSKPQIAEPGSQWYYSNGDVVLLSEAIREASGLSLDQFAEQYLFKPLGITDYRWRNVGETDVVAAGGGLELRPRDMARFGLLILNGGTWNGEQVVSAEWLEQSTAAHARVPFDWLGDLFGAGYGYYWWLDSIQDEGEEISIYSGTGWGGQRISIFPSLDMVVVITGGNYLQKDPGLKIIEKYIVPAIE